MLQHVLRHFLLLLLVSLLLQLNSTVGRLLLPAPEPVACKPHLFDLVRGRPAALPLLGFLLQEPQKEGAAAAAAASQAATTTAAAATSAIAAAAAVSVICLLLCLLSRRFRPLPHQISLPRHPAPVGQDLGASSNRGGAVDPVSSFFHVSLFSFASSCICLYQGIHPACWGDIPAATVAAAAAAMALVLLPSPCLPGFVAAITRNFKVFFNY